MINHIDFTPKVTKKGGIFKAAQIESFQDVVDEMNKWKGQKNPNIVSIETVVLPNIHETDEDGSEDTMLGTGRESSSHWYQLIRVWYTE